jgi:polysaccharide export outer membrane protein
MFRAFARTAIVTLGALAAAGAALATEPGYRLKAGDELQVAVWREETLDRKVAVLPDGTITFPLAGQVAVAGLTPTEIEQTIAARIKKYIPDPVVTATVTGVAGNRVYVVGKVRQPGAFVLGTPMDVMQVLSLAGGLDKFADSDSIRILRGAGAEQQTLPFDYDAVLAGKRPELNIAVQAGDTIVVP